MKKSENTNKVIPFVALGLVLVLWYLVTYFEWVPPFMLPTPGAVLKVFWTDRLLLLNHLKMTLTEAFLGLGIGVSLGFISALLMDRFRLVRDALYPLLVLTQTVPTVAIAPLLVLWMGYGMAPKVTLVVIVTFFPIAMNLYEGFQRADQDATQLLRAMGASHWEIFHYIKWPMSLSSFFSGLKISTSYAIVGAVIAEWLGGYAGLGVYMTKVKKSYSFDKMFAVIVFISLISYPFLVLVQALEKKTMPWKKGSSHEKI